MSTIKGLTLTDSNAPNSQIWRPVKFQAQRREKLEELSLSLSPFKIVQLQRSKLQEDKQGAPHKSHRWKDPSEERRKKQESLREEQAKPYTRGVKTLPFTERNKEGTNKSIVKSYIYRQYFQKWSHRHRYNLCQSLSDNFTDLDRIEA